MPARNMWSNRSGYTPLMEAVSSGNEDIVTALVSAGADTSIKATNGKTATEIARQSHHEQYLQILQKVK